MVAAREGERRGWRGQDEGLGTGDRVLHSAIEGLWEGPARSGPSPASNRLGYRPRMRV